MMTMTGRRRREKEIEVHFRSRGALNCPLIFLGASFGERRGDSDNSVIKEIFNYIISKNI